MALTVSIDGRTDIRTHRSDPRIPGSDKNLLGPVGHNIWWENSRNRPFYQHFVAFTSHLLNKTMNFICFFEVFAEYNLSALDIWLANQWWLNVIDWLYWFNVMIWNMCEIEVGQTALREKCFFHCWDFLAHYAGCCGIPPESNQNIYLSSRDCKSLQACLAIFFFSLKMFIYKASKNACKK